MGNSVVELGWPLLVVLVAISGAAAVVGWLSGLGQARPVLVAAARATVQLLVVSLVLVAVLDSLWLTAAFVLLMLFVASLTSAQRVTNRRARTPAAVARALVLALPIAVGVLPVVVTLLGSGVVPFRGIAVLPVAGILIGGAMTATSLAGRRLLDELAARHGEVEAALSLGFPPRAAMLEIARPVASTALVPGLDQTRTVGLVTLPGAFVGVLLGGGSAVEAGAVQLLVLVGLLAVQTVSVWITLELVARGRLHRVAPEGRRLRRRGTRPA